MILDVWFGHSVVFGIYAYGMGLIANEVNKKEFQLQQLYASEIYVDSRKKYK